MTDGNTDPATLTRLRSLGHAIRRARGQTSQQELGARLGVPQATISRWELGKVELGVEQVRDLAGVLGVEVGDLLMDAGYVTGRGTAGDLFRSVTTMSLAEVLEFLGAALTLDLGISVTNRVVPDGEMPGVEVLEWNVELYERVPGSVAV